MSRLFAANVDTLIRSRGIKRIDLAWMLGCDRAYITQLLGGKTGSIGLEQVRRIADVLNVDPLTLLLEPGAKRPIRCR